MNTKRNSKTLENIQSVHIPEELKILPQWVVWKIGQRKGKPTKVPYCSSNPNKHASVIEPLTWGSFDAAFECYRKGKCDGIGFVFTYKDPYIGVDLDKCGNSKTGKLETWASDIIEQMNTYTEWSPSGSGVHIIMEGSLSPGRRKKHHIEMYDEKHYFTFTGLPVEYTVATIENRQQAIDTLHRTVFDPQDEARANFSPNKLGSIPRVRHDENGLKFERLYCGQGVILESSV